jgi:hypothetical protein
MGQFGPCFLYSSQNSGHSIGPWCGDQVDGAELDRTTIAPREKPSERNFIDERSRTRWVDKCPGRILLARLTSVRLMDEQTGAWLVHSWNAGSSSDTTDGFRRRLPSTGAPPIDSEICRPEVQAGRLNVHHGATAARSIEIRRASLSSDFVPSPHATIVQIHSKAEMSKTTPGNDRPTQNSPREVTRQRPGCGCSGNIDA